MKWLMDRGLSRHWLSGPMTIKMMAVSDSNLPETEAAIFDDALVDQGADNIPIIVMKKTRDHVHGEAVVEKQVADRYRALGTSTQIFKILWKIKLVSLDVESIPRVVAPCHQDTSVLTIDFGLWDSSIIGTLEEPRYFA
jgi:hypothetical protein